MREYAESVKVTRWSCLLQYVREKAAVATTSSAARPLSFLPLRERETVSSSLHRETFFHETHGEDTNNLSTYI